MGLSLGFSIVTKYTKNNSAGVLFEYLPVSARNGNFFYHELSIVNSTN